MIFYVILVTICYMAKQEIEEQNREVISRVRKEMVDSEMSDSFEQFSRNGRWGTCVDCPRDADGRAFPEACELTTRYDHMLNLADLVRSYTGGRANVVYVGRR